ncbi:unnamed protein product [Penicillium bialowiezense]
MFSGMDFKDEGMVNFREFGGYPTSLSPNIATRNGILYRSGHLSNLTPSGWKLLHKLKISTIFCLTTTEEASSLYAKNDQSLSEIENFEIVEIPFHKTKFSRKEVLDKYIEHASRGPIAVAEGYLDLLREGSSVIAKIFLHISAQPDSVFLIHCSMGKDRTGVIFALLLSIAGVSRELVAAEYSLSEEALKPHLPEISKLVQKTTSPDNGHVDIELMARQVISSSTDVMLLTLQMIEDEFGGVSQYLKCQCGLSSNNLDQIQRVLTQTNV